MSAKVKGKLGFFAVLILSTMMMCSFSTTEAQSGEWPEGSDRYFSCARCFSAHGIGGHRKSR